MTLQIDGLSVRFDGVGQVLQDVGLSVAAGQCVAVVGESGAGKSVLARTVLGLAGEGGAAAQIDAHRLEVLGRDVRGYSQRQWRSVRGGGVAMVLQDALGSLDPLRTVGAEVGEALAVRGVRGARRRDQVEAALAAAGLDDPALRMRQRPDQLSGGMRQRALIASAIAGRPELLVADEPTTALDITVAVRVLDLLAWLRDEGLGILLVSHDLGAVSRIADHIVVLHQGRVVESGQTAQVLHDPADPHTQALLAARPRGPKQLRANPAAGRDRPDGDQPILTGSGLAKRYPLPGGGQVAALQDVSITVRPGEAVGIVGESGSGKTTLARVLLAGEAPDAGAVRLGSQPWSELKERARRPQRQRIQYIPQDPLGSMDPRLRVGALVRHGLAAAPADRQRSTPTALLARVGLPPDIVDRYPRSLSGGQRQRLAIARALATNPDILVCDEPVSALDVTVQAQILDLLATLQREDGVALVFISHDLAVVRQVCDAVVVMRDGRIVERGAVEEVFSAPEHPFTAELIRAAELL